MLFVIAARNLLAHARRTTLLGLCIALVSLLLTLFLSVGSEVESAVRRSATMLLSGHLNVSGFIKPNVDTVFTAVRVTPELQKAVKEVLPPGAVLSRRGRAFSKVTSKTYFSDSGIVGLDLENEALFRKNVSIREGRIEDLAQPRTAVLFEEQADRLDAKVGDSITLFATTARANAVDVRVVAIAKSTGFLSLATGIVVPNETLQSLLGYGDDVVGVLHIYLEDLSDLEGLAKRLRERLGKDGFTVMDADARPYWEKVPDVISEDWVGHRLDVTTWEDESSFLSFAVAGVRALTVVVTIVLFALVGVGLVVSMWVVVRERTQEIGALRAMGLQRFGVMRLFFLEGALLGFLGAGVGGILGALIGWAINAAALPLPSGLRLLLMSDSLQLAVGVENVVWAVFWVTTSIAFVGLFPSLRAARLSPRVAMDVSE